MSVSAQSFICGDFNVDFSRSNNNSLLLSDLMKTHNLVQADLCSNISYTYRRDDMSAHSWPDHVLTSRHLMHLVKEISCVDYVDNFSDQLPLFFSLALSPQATPKNKSRESRSSLGSPSNTRVAWDQISSVHLASYCNLIQQNLPLLSEELLSCCDSSCKVHRVVLDDICSQLFQCISNAADLCFPKVTSCARSQRIPGWNGAARSLCEIASFWHRLWSQCGHPTSGVLFQIKKKVEKML